MKKLAFLLPLLTCVGLLLLSRGAVAQFETVNRSFHNATGFPLDGRHLTVSCEQCHVNGQYGATPRTCYDCHWARRQDDRYQLRLGAQCEQCHRTTSWNAVRWDHGGETGAPLNADHRQIGCEGCHRQARFVTATSCIECHQKDYAATTAPNHAAAGFSLDCTSCHSANDASWKNNGGLGFNHDAFYPLRGAHATTSCQSCHKNNLYKGTQTTCVGCHLPEYNKTTQPNHIAAGFTTACDTCHRDSDTTWNNSFGFDHNQFFPLVGLHATATCVQCHANNVFKGTATTCVGCHLAEYNAAKNPNHPQSGFGTDCESCHRANDPSWATGTFNHNPIFALLGVHATTPCASCHVNNVFKGTARDCVGCHLKEYNASRNPNHVQAGFSTTCDQCHRGTDPTWNNGSAGGGVGGGGGGGGGGFNHDAVFPLVGVHATTPCAVCHVNNQFAGTPTTCVGCHLKDYNGARDPNHVGAGFNTVCDTCHRDRDPDWSRAPFSHPWFALQFNHAVPCSQCHTTPTNYFLFSCTNCHARGATDPLHVGVSGYIYQDNACYSCHPRG